MKNIHVLPTDKASRVYLDSNNNINITDIEMKSGNKQNICITNDEEPKEGWILINGFILRKIDYIDGFMIIDNTGGKHHNSVCKKIILTDIKNLIKDGVQAIDDEFLEFFVKNPSCEEVEIYREKPIGYTDNIHITFWGLWKIIIPKEEPKQEYEYQSECICGTECKEFTNVKCKKK